jgi:hypothetical protein
MEKYRAVKYIGDWCVYDNQTNKTVRLQKEHIEKLVAALNAAEVLSALQSKGAVANEPPTRPAVKLPPFSEVKSEVEQQCDFLLGRTDLSILKFAYLFIERQLKA